MVTSPNEGAKRRLLSEVAAATGAMRAAEKTKSEAAAKRGKAALRAQVNGASYSDIQEATGLTKVGVYKMLERANGGPLKGDA